MHKKFQQIKEEYDKFYKSLLKVGRLPVKQTSHGFWGVSAADDVFDLFRKIKLQNAKSFIDIGSGDGKVVMIASLFTKATGIEIDNELHAQAINAQKNLRLNVSIIKDDYRKYDLSKYDVIFLNPDSPLHELEPKLHRELKGKLLVFGHMYHPEFLQKEATHDCCGTLVSVYKKP